MKAKRVLGMFLAVSMAITMLAGCGGSSSATTSTEEETAAEEEETTAEEAVDEEEASAESSDYDYSSIKVGVICPATSTDGGWSQSVYTGMVDAFAELGMPEENLYFVENVSDTGTDFANTAEGLVAEGCDIIIGGSSSYQSSIEEFAPKYPDIQFAQANGTSMYGNLVGYEIRSYDAMFVCGYLAALMSDGDELGYCAAQPEASVVQGINAYALGAKYANENATVRNVWVNSWYDPTAEAEAANSLISLGINVIGINLSSPAVPQACEEAGGYCAGYHVDMIDYAPDAMIVSYMWNWTPLFVQIIEEYAASGVNDEFYYWGAEKGCSTISDINTDIVPEDIAAQTMEVFEQIQSGELVVLAGEIKDNEGNVRVEEGEVMDDETNRNMGFLVENVIGQLP